MLERRRPRTQAVIEASGRVARRAPLALAAGAAVFYLEGGLLGSRGWAIPSLTLLIAGGAAVALQEWVFERWDGWRAARQAEPVITRLGIRSDASRSRGRRRRAT